MSGGSTSSGAGGRLRSLARAGGIAVWLAVPDYTSRPRRRRATRAAILAGGLAAAGLGSTLRTPASTTWPAPGAPAEPADETAVGTLEPAAESAAGSGGEQSGTYALAGRVGLVVVAGLASLAAARVAGRATTPLAAELHTRGSAHPWTVVGILVGGASLTVDAVAGAAIRGPVEAAVGLGESATHDRG